MDNLRQRTSSNGVRDLSIWCENSEASSLTIGGHSMSDPGTTYRTREEIQNMRSSNDAIQGMKSKLLEWGVVTEAGLKVALYCNIEAKIQEIDKAARKKVDDEVAEAEKSPERTFL